MSQPQTSTKAPSLPPQIIGWEKIMPELAAFFTALKMRTKNKNDLTPFNLFLSGRPGTNKTHGILHLCECLGFTVGIIDCSTLDDVAELAGGKVESLTAADWRLSKNGIQLKVRARVTPDSIHGHVSGDPGYDYIVGPRVPCTP